MRKASKPQARPAPLSPIEAAARDYTIARVALRAVSLQRAQLREASAAVEQASVAATPASEIADEALSVAAEAEALDLLRGKR